MACSLGIPAYIVSDNDGNTKTIIESQIANIERDLSTGLTNDVFNVSFLNDGCDIESELVNHVQIIDELKSSLVKLATNGNGNPQFIDAKQREMEQLDTQNLLDRLEKDKSGYSGFLAGIIIDSSKNSEKLIPQAFINAFESIRGW
ncbi:ATP-dependent endonuclease, partial [Methylococcaceae bacterium CS5]